jgi:hypothetical protein
LFYGGLILGGYLGGGVEGVSPPQKASVDSIKQKMQAMAFLDMGFD